MTHPTVGVAYENALQIPVEIGDVVVADDAVFPVSAITNTGLVRLADSSSVGVAEFRKAIDDAERLRIDRGSYPTKEAGHIEYNQKLRTFRDEYPSLGAFVTIPVEADEYYLTESGGAGFAIDGDTLVGLFNHTDPSGTGERLVVEALRRGVADLMCFDTALVDIYERWGFSEYDRAPWDEDLAPENWDYEQFGKPDVVWMEI